MCPVDGHRERERLDGLSYAVRPGGLLFSPSTNLGTTCTPTRYGPLRVPALQAEQTHTHTTIGIYTWFIEGPIGAYVDTGGL